MRSALALIIEGSIYLILIFSPIAFGAIHRLSLSFVEGVLLLTGILYVLQEWKTPFEMGLVRRHPYLFPFGMFCLLVLFQTIPMPLAILGIFSSRAPALYEGVLFPEPTGWRAISLYAFQTQKSVLFIASLVVLFFLVLHFRSVSGSFEKRLVRLLIAMGVIEAAYGLGTYWLEIPYMLWFRTERAFVNATGTFINRNHFAGYLIMLIPMSLACWRIRALSTTSGRHSPLEKRGSLLNAMKGGGLAACLIVLCLALLYSHSRAGILSLAVGLVFFAIFCDKTIFRSPALWISGILATALLGWAVVSDKGLEILKFRVLVELNPTSQYFKFNRLMVWLGSWDIVKDFPLFGTGMGTFSFIYPAYSKEVITARYVYAHSDWLQLLVETGILGFTLVAGSFAWFVFASLHRLKKSASREDRILGTGLLSGLVAISFQNLAEFNMHMPSNAILFTVFAGLVCRLTGAAPKDNKTLIGA